MKPGTKAFGDFIVKPGTKAFGDFIVKPGTKAFGDFIVKPGTKAFGDYTLTRRALLEQVLWAAWKPRGNTRLYAPLPTAQHTLPWRTSDAASASCHHGDVTPAR